MAIPSLEASAIAAGIDIEWTDAFGKAQRMDDETLHGLLNAMQWPSPDVIARPGSPRRRQKQQLAAPMLVTALAGQQARVPIPPGADYAGLLRDEHGNEQDVRVDAHGCFRAPVAIGYYELLYDNSCVRVAVAPPRCYGVADAMAETDARAWGLNAQVYSLRREHGGGLGDSRAVAELAGTTARAGGHALGLSPMHAVRRHGGLYSPYSPSHRGFLDWIYADAAQVLGNDAVQAALAHTGLAEAWAAHEQDTLVDWPAAYAIRRQLWQQLHAQFKERPPVALKKDLRAFIKQGGDALRAHARITAREMLREEHQQGSGTVSATAIPYSFQAEQHFEVFAQWLASRCWQRTQQAARDAGQKIGLIWDLAVGCDPSGSEAWTYRHSLLAGLSLGAPPDALGPDGQSWGITTYSPWGLKASGFQPFIDLLRANMQRGGGLRMDHVLGFQRLWVVPHGQSAKYGGYLRYPTQDMLRLLALESWRAQCIVIGEDLGTVPDGLRHLLADHNVMGTDVLLFVRDNQGAFLPPGQWRPNAMATTTTHDLPTLLGWRAARDVDLRADIYDVPSTRRAEQHQQRRQEVAALDRALAAHSPDHSQHNGMASNRPSIDFVMASPAQLVMIPLEDALDRLDQPNLPGTVHEHPNWRHRLPQAHDAALRPAIEGITRSPLPGSPSP